MWQPEGMADSFAARFAAVRARFGPLVWGLDPSGDLLNAWGFGDTAAGLDRFADTVLEAAAGAVGLVKPQSAFYERHGWRGIRTLQRLLASARSAGLLTILDVKRGDVGSTNDAYAEAFLGAGAPLEADAVTVHPYLGLAAMGAFVSRASSAGACLLVVTRSSNPEGRIVQEARVVPETLAGPGTGNGPGTGDRPGTGDGPGTGDSPEARAGRSVEETLLAEIGTLNAALAPGQIGPVGAVVAATYLDRAHLEPALDLPAAHALFLAPGVGAQGATSADVARTFAACPGRVMPSASRLLLSAGPDLGALRDAAATLAAEFRAALPPAGLDG
jgi:orotidine-5'-phosphate decarboxylase